MYVHNINPVIFNIGPLSFRYYGLVYGIGFLIAYLVLRNVAIHKKIENLTEDLVDKLTMYIILAVILGGRLGEIFFYNFSYYVKNPLNTLAIWQGGMSFHGALIAVSIVVVYFCTKYKISFLEIADTLSIPAALVLFLGRIANFINAELVGILTRGEPWYCINYSNYGIPGCRHPSQIYEALKNLFIGFFLIFQKKYFKLKKGMIFFSFITLYGLLRFLVTFFRADRLIFLGLSEGQLLSLAMVFVGLSLCYWRIKN